MHCRACAGLGPILQAAQLRPTKQSQPEAGWGELSSARDIFRAHKSEVVGGGSSNLLGFCVAWETGGRGLLTCLGSKRSFFLFQEEMENIIVYLFLVSSVWGTGQAMKRRGHPGPLPPHTGTHFSGPPRLFLLR